MRCWLSGIVALGCAALVSPARADAPLLSLELIECEQPDEVRTIVALELGTRTRAAEAEHATQVVARCAPDHALLEVRDPLTHKRLERSIALATVHARAQPRVIGIAIAELVSASWYELERTPREPASSAEALRARDAAVHAVRAREALWRASVGLGPLLRLSPAVHAPGFGGALQLLAHSPYGLRLSFDLAAAYAQRTVALGRLETTALSLGAAGLLDARGGHFGAQAGLGLRGGIARVRGESRDDDVARSGDVSGGWLGPMVIVGSDVALADWAALQLGVELGQTLVSVRGRMDGREAAAIDGTWVAIALSLHVLL